MSQSSWIAGFMFLAFFIYITMKGELPKYMGFLLSTPQEPIKIGGETKIGLTSNTTKTALDIAQLAAIVG